MDKGSAMRREAERTAAMVSRWPIGMQPAALPTGPQIGESNRDVSSPPAGDSPEDALENDDG